MLTNNNIYTLYCIRIRLFGVTTKTMREHQWNCILLFILMIKTCIIYI